MRMRRVGRRTMKRRRRRLGVEVQEPLLAAVEQSSLRAAKNWSRDGFDNIISIALSIRQIFYPI